mgnify:CR=1 FL=1
MTKRTVVCVLGLLLVGVLAVAAWDSLPRVASAQEARALVRRLDETMARDIWRVIDTSLGSVCYVQAYSGAMDCMALPLLGPKKTSTDRSAP